MIELNMRILMKKILVVSLVLLIASVLAAWSVHSDNGTMQIADCLLCKLGMFFSFFLVCLAFVGLFRKILDYESDALYQLTYSLIFVRIPLGRSPPMSLS